MAGKTELQFTPLDFELEFEELIYDFTKDVSKKISQKAPKDRGDYARDIGATKIKSSTNVKSSVVHNTGDTYRLGHILEFGTSGKHGQPAQPHYRPVVKQTEDAYVQLMRNVDIKER